MRVLPSVLLVLPMLVPSAAASLLLGGFAPDLPGSEADDAFEIWNTGDGPVSLADVWATDNEGTVGFSSDLSVGPGARLRVALDADAYVEAARAPPDVAPTLEAERRLRTLEAGFLLARDGDELSLIRDGKVLDAVVWGDAETPSAGWNGAAARADGPMFLRWFARTGANDTDTARDWEAARQPRLGWRVSQPVTFAGPGRAVAFTSPDSSRAAVQDFLDRATSHVRINVYEFRDVEVALRLRERLLQDLDFHVDLLVDEQPVGLSAEERLVRNRILWELEEAGARVRLMQHYRYNFDHAKYVVADEGSVLVQSENFVHSGLSTDGVTGNRGWGVIVDSPDLARELAAVFDHDFVLDPHGARQLGPDDVVDVPLPVSHPGHVPGKAQTSADAVAVTLLAAPEATLGDPDPVLRAIAGAQREIVVEQLQLPSVWRDPGGHPWPNEYLDALRGAAQRGVRLRVLLDGHFLGGDRYDNDHTVRGVAEWAAEGLPAEARLMPESGRVLHVKGMVVDERLALVGSMNWNLNSVAQNREVDLLLESPELARFYLQAFEVDWSDAAPSDGDGILPTPGPAATVIIAPVLAVAALLRRLAR